MERVNNTSGDRRAGPAAKRPRIAHGGRRWTQTGHRARPGAGRPSVFVRDSGPGQARRPRQEPAGLSLPDPRGSSGSRLGATADQTTGTDCQRPTQTCNHPQAAVIRPTMDN